MLVYRIENRAGFGAFHDLAAYHDKHALDEGLKESVRHPTVYSGEETGTALSAFMTGPYLDRHLYRFACRSLHQLRMWFRCGSDLQQVVPRWLVWVAEWSPIGFPMRT